MSNIKYNEQEEAFELPYKLWDETRIVRFYVESEDEIMQNLKGIAEKLAKLDTNTVEYNMELLSVSEPVREAMLRNKSAMEIKKIAVAEGMHTLLQNGWEQVKRGLTSWSALLHFAAIDLSEASTGVEGVDAAS